MNDAELAIKIRAKLEELQKLSKQLKSASKDFKKVGDNAQKEGRRVTQAGKEMSNSMKGLKTAVLGAVAAFAGFVTLRGAINFFRESVDLASEQQEIFARLQISLNNLGISYKAVEQDLANLFATQQRQTKFGDDVQAQALQQLVNITGDYEVALQALPRALDLASASGRPLRSVSRSIGQAIAGNVTALGTYIAELQNVDATAFRAADQQERLSLTLQALDSRFQGVAKSMQFTYLGALARLNNAYGDFQEAIGDFITNSPVVIALIQELAFVFEVWSGEIAESGETLGGTQQKANDFLDTLQGLAKATNVVIVLFGALIDIGKIIIKTFQALALIAGNAARQIKIAFLESLKGVITVANKIPILGERLGATRGLINKLNAEIAESTNNIDDNREEIEGVLTEIRNVAIGMGDIFDEIAQGEVSIDEFFGRVRGRLPEVMRRLQEESVRTGVSIEELFAKFQRGEKTTSKTKDELNKFNDTLRQQIVQLKEQIALFGKSEEEAIKFRNQQILLSKDADDATKALVEQKEALELHLLQMQKTEEQMEAVREAFKELEGGMVDTSFTGQFLAFVESLKAEGSALPQFFASIADQMATAFEDFFFNVMKGNFSSMKDFAQQAFDSILRSFAVLVSKMVTQKIILDIGARISGEATEGLGVFDTLKDLFGEGGKVQRGAEKINEVFTSLLTKLRIPGAGTFGQFGVPILGAVLGGIFDGVDGALKGLGSGLGFLGGQALGGIVSGAIGGTLGSIAGSIIPVIGTILGGILGSFIGGLFKKKPRLDIEFDRLRDDEGNAIRALTVEELFNIRDEDIFVGVKKIKGVDKDGIRDTIRKLLNAQIERIVGIISLLPVEIFEQLEEDLFNTVVDIESKVGGKRLLEFDKKKKNIKEAFEQFIGGEMQARFNFAIRDFFEGMLVTLGVFSEDAERFIEQAFEEFGNIGSREGRAEFGEQFLQDIQAFVVAFNLVNQNMQSAFDQAINQVAIFARGIGLEFNGLIPSLNDIRQALAALLQTAEITAETVQRFAQLRSAILELTFSLAQSVSQTIGTIQSLNSSIQGLGGSGVDLTPQIEQAIGSILPFVSDPNLSLEEQEQFLGIAISLSDQLKATETTVRRIDNSGAINRLRTQISLIQEQSQERIKGLEAEKQAIQNLLDLQESIRELSRSLLLGNTSILSPFEKLGVVTGEVNQLFAELESAVGDADRFELGQRLRDTLADVVEIAGEAFDAPSLEFRSLFRDVIEELDRLEALIEPTRSIEEINEEIALIEANTLRQVELLNNQISRLEASQVQTITRVNRSVLELQTFLRDEAMRILEARLALLAEIGADAIVTELSVAQAQLTELQLIRLAVEQSAGIAGVKGQTSLGTATGTQLVTGGTSGQVTLQFNISDSGDLTATTEAIKQVILFDPEIRRVLGL